MHIIGYILQLYKLFERDLYSLAECFENGYAQFQKMAGTVTDASIVLIATYVCTHIKDNLPSDSQ